LRAPEPPPGFLRLLVVFHESEALGAGLSVTRALPRLGGYGWTSVAWFPGEGPLVDVAADVTSARALREKPIAYSLRGWRAPPGPVERLRATPAYLRSFRRALLHVRPHVVHVNTLRALPEATVARTLGLPVVVHVHELPDAGAKRACTLRWAAAVADVLVGVSEAVSTLLRRYASRVPVTTVYNGVEPSSVRRSSATAGTVGTVGTVCRTKGTDLFLEAAALARAARPDLRFEHIGQTGLDRDAEFARRMTRLLGEAPVTMLGRRPAKDGLARWETFVLASRQDAFPLATLEAMAAGLPVVATRVGGVVEQIRHLETGVLVPPEDPRSLADWIVRLHEDRSLAERLGRAAAETVRGRFALESQAAGLHRAYLAALNERHGPPQVRPKTREALGAASVQLARADRAEGSA
jgi:glycosyltransferase involved in cell wall biosynthesis